MDEEKERDIVIVSDGNPALCKKLTETLEKNNYITHTTMNPHFGIDTDFRFINPSKFEAIANEKTYGKKRGFLVTLFPGIKI